jgi:hypothetical protein
MNGCLESERLTQQKKAPPFSNAFQNSEDMSRLLVEERPQLA